MENIDIDIAIDNDILENIDIDIDIDKEILENIDIDKISNRLEFGISNRAMHLSSYIGPSEGVLAAALSHSEWLVLSSPGYYMVQ